MNKGDVTTVLRRLGLMHLADQTRYYWLRFKNRQENNAFRAAHPTLSLPPDYLMYEAFQLSYHRYYEGGREAAEWVRDQLAAHMELPGKHILDWGCGPSRIIRHLPQVIGAGCQFTGTDYNPQTIDWCRQHIPGVTFLLNGLEPPLPLPDEAVDALYGISIFTHLSESSHRHWFQELLRVTKPGGLLLLTTHGAAFKGILTEVERAAFDSGNLVVRSNVQEGHRVFAAFQPAEYLRALFAPETHVVHYVPGSHTSGKTSQDLWILRKENKLS